MTRPGSIRSSLMDGLGTPCRWTKEQCLTVSPCPYPHWRPAFLDAGILIMLQQVRLNVFSLNMADFPSPSSPCPPQCFYSLSFVVGPLLQA